MAKYEITLWIDGEPKEIHTFNLSYSDKGFYTAAVSIGAFSKRENTRLYNAHLKGKWLVTGKRASVKWGEDLMHKIMYPTLPLPTFEHSSVWDFYKAIGYDYKKKRYVGEC